MTLPTRKYSLFSVLESDPIRLEFLSLGKGGSDPDIFAPFTTNPAQILGRRVEFKCNYQSVCFWYGWVSFYKTDFPTNNRYKLLKKYKDQPQEGNGEQTKQAVSEGNLAFREMEW